MGILDRETQWTQLSVSRIEDLSDAIHGAGLDAMQMSRAPVTGSLAFATCDDVTCNTGYVGGYVSIKGSLSKNMVTLGLGVVLPPGSSQWLNETLSGDIGVFLPGDVQDALYAPGSMYAAATLSFERLEEMAAKIGVALDRKILSGSGVVKGQTSGAALAKLRSEFWRVHSAEDQGCKPSPAALSRQLLDIFIGELGREPRPHLSLINSQKYARIVARAREFIYENLEHPLSIDMIATAASTTRRTLHRAFVTVLNETPYSYVLKLRLHRIRCELVSDAERRCTITSVANRWGITELGRFSHWYREHFGELPSQTLAG
ncbi:helix-turn-helix domain-containing protein [Methylocystis parvus]|uniref:Helix-turn-helix transcriptional regulator n=1 Tax=Methylocystis parvus TaxID=134 RepID=A0A6B8M329_9HYPH|nr:AraC family transcriptional regulator [Methylocystis parvus]QGM96745.1 helix-turn-helix transcriptional regulator [Methylocystis parvus]WBJ99382.1 AraC family transcriptional regulator [Methylocystis parvus OBBP]